MALINPLRPFLFYLVSRQKTLQTPGLDQWTIILVVELEVVLTVGHVLAPTKLPPMVSGCNH